MTTWTLCIYNSQTSMQVRPQSRQLSSILSKIYRRRLHLVLSKLIIYQQQPQSLPPVGHYDYQCEGLVMLAGLFKKKQLTVLIKAFNSIRTPTSTNKKRITSPPTKICFGSTRNIATTKNEVNCLKVPLGGSAGSSRKANSENSLALSNARSTASRLEGILQRLKEVNSTSHLQSIKKPQRLNAQNSTVYLDGSRYRQILRGGTCSNLDVHQNLKKNYSSRDLSGQKSKKWMILSKLKELEDNLAGLDIQQPRNYPMEYLSIPNQAGHYTRQLLFKLL